MKIKIIDRNFSVCKVKEYSLDDFKGEFCFTGKTDEEKSLVCQTENVPAETIERNDGWRAFKIDGILDFSLIGILSKILTLLAESKIGVFTVSTYNTDYILVKEENFSEAIDILKKAGYEII